MYILRNTKHLDIEKKKERKYRASKSIKHRINDSSLGLKINDEHNISNTYSNRIFYVFYFKKKNLSKSFFRFLAAFSKIWLNFSLEWFLCKYMKIE